MTELNPAKIYTTREAADVLQINLQTCRKWIREGKLPSSKLGKEYRISGEDIKSFLDQNK